MFDLIRIKNYYYSLILENGQSFFFKHTKSRLVTVLYCPGNVNLSPVLYMSKFKRYDNIYIYIIISFENIFLLIDWIGSKFSLISCFHSHETCIVFAFIKSIKEEELI